MKVLITGHPRSGTGYCAQLCMAYGLQVGHEVMRENGISSWLFAPLSNFQPPFHPQEGSRMDFEFDKVIGVIRNPIDIIASTAYTEHEHSEHWRAAFVFIPSGASEIVRAAYSVVGWYKMLGALGIKVYRIDEIEEHIKHISMLFEHGFHEDAQKLFEPDQKYNTRVHPVLTSEELESKLPTDLFNEVIKLCKTYNYD